MEIRNLIKQKKDLYQHLLDFIEDESSTDEDFNNLLDFFEKENITKDRQNFDDFLQLVSKIAKNHFRGPDFIKKITKILINFKTEIKQTFTNIEVFLFFKSNKLILYYLIQNEIIEVEELISNYFLNKSKKKYPEFFYPQISSFLQEEEKKKIESELSKYDQSFIKDNFERMNQIGENENYICELIRKDSVEEFITIINQQNVSIKNSRIQLSIFETNSFLLKNTPSLIEYAAFFGSIQIFRYLLFNKAPLDPYLWLYSIHGKNPEIIHLLEENHVFLTDKSYNKFLVESIKCHHNDIARYILDNFLVYKDNEKIIGESIVDYSFRYRNYSYFPDYLNNNYVFYCMCKYDYCKLIDIYLDINKKDIVSTIISTTKKIFLMKFQTNFLIKFQQYNLYNS